MLKADEEIVERKKLTRLKETSSFEQRCVQKNFVSKNGFKILF